jgi:hypothetical protein
MVLRTVSYIKTLCAGYPRITSGLMLNPKTITKVHTTLFPLQNDGEEPWLHNENCYKRHFLSFPQFPFRTLHPRNVNTYFQNDQTFNSSSPIFPANTQINIIYKRRGLKNLLNYLLPTNLNYLYGSQKSTLSVEERQTGLSYTVTQPAAAPAAPAAGANAAAIEAYEAAVAVAAAAAPVSTEWEITNVDININDLYLQVNLYLRLYVQNFYNYINNV